MPFYVLVILGFHKSYENINREQMESNAKLMSYIVESLNGVGTIKSYNAEKEVIFEMEKRFVSLLRHFFKNGMISNLQGTIK
ncbi:bacteriocin ABC transporter ATP-binding protein, partial [Bacillus cereus]